MVNHVGQCAGSLRVHRRVAVAVPRLRDRRASGCAAAGFTRTVRDGAGPRPGRYFTVRGGSLIAWDTPARHRSVPDRRRPHRQPQPAGQAAPDRVVAGWQVVALQPYGGAWLNSWLDRDLGVAAGCRVRGGQHARTPAGAHRRPDAAGAAAGDPPVRGPQGRDARPAAARQRRLGRRCGPRSFLAYVAERAGVDAADVLGLDLMTHDLTPSRSSASTADFVSAPRLDNQATCYAGARGVPGRRADAATCRCSRCSTTRRSARSPTTARSPSCC